MPGSFLNILPDPSHSISPGGFDGLDEPTGAVAGQGFASVKLTDSRKIEQDKTLTGKLINRSNKASRWLIDINYNPMTRAQFDPINNFLLEKRGSLKAFQVSLPQYRYPQDTTWKAYNEAEFGTNVTFCSVPALAGSTSILVWGPTAWDTPVYSTGLPKAGDFFNILDAEDSLHTKAYRVTHVETELLYQNIPNPSTIRVHFTPGLQRPISLEFIANVEIRFYEPLFTVEQTQDVQAYSLGSNNLYSFSLRLKEAFY